jgi:two-component SAPR family response regulator
MRDSQQDQPPLHNETLTRPPMSVPTLIAQKPARAGLRVFCLGPFRVYRGPAEIHDREWGQGNRPTRKIKALFAYLLDRKEHGARKDTLIDLLWPKKTEYDRASAVFHVTLHCLRRVLEPELRSMASSSYIRYENGRYCFEPLKPYWLDADAFEFYCRRAEACDRYGDLEAAMLYWGMAINLYGGEYMAGVDPNYTENRDYDWCAPRRQHLQELYLRALLEMAHYYYNNREYSLCLECAREALEYEPGVESIHRLAMKCLIKCRQLESAKDQYRLCEAELARYEARAPSEQTQQLYERIKAGVSDQ